MSRVLFSRKEVFVSDCPFDDPLLVSFNYTKGRPGSMYKSNGDPGDPPEGDELEILSATFNGLDVYDTLTAEEQRKIEDACFEIAYESDGVEYDHHYGDDWR